MKIRTTHVLAATVRGQRQKLQLTQAALAEAAMVSRAWLIEFEQGKHTVEIGRVLAVIEALGMTLDLRVSDPPSAEARPNDLSRLREEYYQGADRA